jgi:hypothetical protein
VQWIALALETNCSPRDPFNFANFVVIGQLRRLMLSSPGFSCHVLEIANEVSVIDLTSSTGPRNTSENRAMTPGFK